MRLLPGFLTASEIVMLRGLCSVLQRAHHAYRTDRGYLYIPVVNRMPVELLAPRSRAAAALGTWPNDCFFLVYGAGERAPPHVDEGRASRLIALIEGADAGGELIIGGVSAQLAVGDAVVFRPAAEVHEVTEVTGRRVVWSVGVRSR